MPVTLTESTVIAANRRLNETHVVVGGAFETVLTETDRHFRCGPPSLRFYLRSLGGS